MSDTKIESLKIAGHVAARIHQKIAQLVKPGVDLLEIETLAKDEMKSHETEPAFLGFKGYPAVTCLSVNDEIVHGIPRHYILQVGDILSVDLGVKKNGWIVDTARTHAVGKVSQELENLLAVTNEALNRAIAVCRKGNRTGDIGQVIESYVTKNGFFIVRDLTGHGVGQTLQEPPTIYNYGQKGHGTLLKEGMVIAVEPITTVQKTDIGLGADGWTIMSDSGAIGAHFEDTLVITDGEPLVLTR